MTYVTLTSIINNFLQGTVRRAFKKKIKRNVKYLKAYQTRSNLPPPLSLYNTYTVKKVAIFPSPTGMSLAKLSLAGNKNDNPGQGELS
jgi:benzoyl-CoA reductase/2-hydroxyglutaryl-CoA dehydratase subunit BcrC/BadD/HgdB